MSWLLTTVVGALFGAAAAVVAVRRLARARRGDWRG